MKLEDELKNIEISMPLFDIMVGNLKKNMASNNPQITMDKTGIVIEKLNNVSEFLKTFQKNLRKQIDSIEGDTYRWQFAPVDEESMMKALRSTLGVNYFKRASVGTLIRDKAVLEKIIAKNKELVLIFASVPKYTTNTKYVKYEKVLHTLYMDFLLIVEEFKTLLKWYDRLIELGY
jgi:hypothetical protein